MSKIQISNLQPAGAELFQGSESFLTELKATEAHNISGGSSKYKGYESNNSNSNSNSNSYNIGNGLRPLARRRSGQCL